MSRSSRNHALPLVALALTTAAAAASVAYRHPRNAFDLQVRRALVRRQRPRPRRVARALGPLGKPYGHGPVALALAGTVVKQTGYWRDGAPVVAASTAAALASRAFERYLPARRPPPGRQKPDEPSFPSGHALETAAVATAAWIVLGRNEIGRRAVVAPIAMAIPLISGAAKLYLDRHWATDVLGGWGIGVLLGAAIGAGRVGG